MFIFADDNAEPKDVALLRRLRLGITIAANLAKGDYWEEIYYPEPYEGILKKRELYV